LLKISLDEVKEFIENVRATILPIWLELADEAANQDSSMFPFHDRISPLYSEEYWNLSLQN